MSSGLPTPSLACALVALALAAPTRAAPALAGWGSLPVSYEPNRGQTHPSVDFIARSRDGVGFLAGGALTLRFDRHAVRISLAGARPRKPEAQEPLPGITSYFLGSDPSRWIAGIPTYGQVLYREVLPGVDLRYHGFERHLELDMILAPGASPGRLRLTFDGADRVAVDSKGDLQVTVAGQPLTLRRPVAYQEIAGERRAVAAEYVVKGKRAVAIALGGRDLSRPVVVDPVLVYSAQIGSDEDDGLEAVAVDSSGAAYATGYAALGFPIMGGTQGYGGAIADVVVLKLNPAGTALVYSVYLGGAFPEYARGIAVDAAGNAIVAGMTGSADYPIASPIQDMWSGGPSDAFATKLNATGTMLIYSTYLGGGQADDASAVAVDGSGNAYITGGTQSNDWIVTPDALQPVKGGNRDAFVLKLSPTGSRLYSTYVGGQQEDYAQGIAVNGAGEMFVAGATTSSDFPTSSSPHQSMNLGGLDAFVFKLSSDGSQLLFSTYLGGGANDIAESVAVRPNSSGPVVAGQTLSLAFPSTPGSYDPAGSTGSDAFVTELSSTGGLVFSTFLAGTGDDMAYAVALGLTGGPWVAGRTGSTNFPTPGGPFQGATAGGGDAFVAQLSSNGSALSYSTYLGSTGDDQALGVAVDDAGGTYVVGESEGAFPSAPGSYRNPGLLIDAFAAKLLTVPGPAPDGGTDGGGADGGGGGGDGGVPDGGVPDGGGPRRPVDLLGCTCAAGVSNSTAFALAMLAAIAARDRQRRRPTSAPPSQ